MANEQIRLIVKNFFYIATLQYNISGNLPSHSQLVDASLFRFSAGQTISCQETPSGWLKIVYGEERLTFTPLIIVNRHLFVNGFPHKNGCECGSGRPTQWLLDKIFTEETIAPETIWMLNCYKQDSAILIPNLPTVGDTITLAEAA
jgi:hypothetical protein